MNIEEKELWERAYKIGMMNGWCSGRYAMEDGDYIVKEDRLNENSYTIIYELDDLYKFFKYGNWCLGNAVIHKNLCFIQQVNGGDEWLTIKNFPDEAIAFESMSFERMDYNEFENVVEHLLKATKGECVHLEWNKGDANNG